MVRLLTLCAVAGPLLATLVLGAAVLGSALAGPGVGGAPINIAEAAAQGSAAEVVRRVRQGEDPRGIRALRPESISSSVLRASALEAAVWSREVELVELLDRLGAFQGNERERIGCLARATVRPW